MLHAFEQRHDISPSENNNVQTDDLKKKSNSHQNQVVRKQQDNHAFINHHFKYKLCIARSPNKLFVTWFSPEVTANV
jgi:hypothetical protein